MQDAIDGEFREVGRAVAVREDHATAVQPFFGAMRPADKIAYATEIANALKPILTQKKLVHKLNNRNPDDEYVELEGWQTCGNLCGVTAMVEWTRPLADGSGYEARAIVVRVDNGVTIGGGESICSKSEQKWRTRDDYAIKGMAQTRAQSRALRGVLAWILVLAGFKPTPAEEMPPEGINAEPQAAARRSVPVKRVPQDELFALAASMGYPTPKAFGEWAATQVAPDLMERERRVLTDAETVRAKELLEAMIPQTVQDDSGKMTPKTQGRLFALLDERLSTEKEARLIFAAEHGIVVDSFSALTETQARTLIRQLEMIPPPQDPDDALADYAEGRL
jgi:hypothetical protein